MASGHEALVERLDRLESELLEVRRRLASVEERYSSAPQAPLAAPVAAITPTEEIRQSPSASTELGWYSGSVALAGRTFLVLAGAFLLRALTDSGYMPATVGVAAGLFYAAFWLLTGDRDAGLGQRLSAHFHGLTATAIAFPIIWETTIRTGQMSTEASAASLAIYCSVALALAWRANLQALAWISTLFTVATAVGLMFATRAFATYTLVLLLVAVWTELMALHDRWPGLRVLPTLAVGSSVLLFAYVLAGPRGLPSDTPPYSIALMIAIAMLFPAVYVASLLAGAIWRRKEITLLPVLLVLVAVGSGLGGGAWMLAAQRTTPAAIGLLSLLLSAGCYAVAWRLTNRRQGRLLDEHALPTFGLLLALVGAAMLLSGGALALLWSALALALGALGWRYRSIVLSRHGSAFLLGAALASGLAPSTWDALTAAANGAWRPVVSAGYFVAVAAAIVYVLLLGTHARAPGSRSDLLCSLLTAAILGWSLVGLIVWGLASFAGAPGAGADAAVLATLRTVVLAVLTVGLFWVGRRWERSELIWLAYSLLALGGAKLLFEDFRVGRPATLFISLAFYGCALILTSSLLRRAARRREGAAGSGG